MLIRRQTLHIDPYSHQPTDYTVTVIMSSLQILKTLKWFELASFTNDL